MGPLASAIRLIFWLRNLADTGETSWISNCDKTTQKAFSFSLKKLFSYINLMIVNIGYL